MVTKWSPEQPPGTLVFAAFANTFAQLASPAAKSAILNLLEDQLQNGTQELKNAIATGLWEALLASASKGEFDFGPIVMGEASLKFCKDWDAFTGVRTPGLV